MAKKEVKAITLAKNEAKKSIKPFCEKSAEKLVAQLATDHPKCVHLGFSIAFLSK